MTDFLEVREDGDSVISGTVSRDELEAELTPLNPRSLFDRRLKTVLRDMLDEADDDEIVVEALVRNADADQFLKWNYFWKVISIFRLDASSGIRSKRSWTFV